MSAVAAGARCARFAGRATGAPGPRRPWSTDARCSKDKPTGRQKAPGWRDQEGLWFHAGGAYGSAARRSGSQRLGRCEHPGRGTTGRSCSGACCHAGGMPHPAGWSRYCGRSMPMSLGRRRSRREHRGQIVIPPVLPESGMHEQLSCMPGHRASRPVCRSRRPPTSMCRHRRVDTSRCVPRLAGGHR